MPIALLMLLIHLAPSPALADDPTDEFESGAPELQEQEPVRYSDGKVYWEVLRGAHLACHRDRCELASVDSSGRSFTVEFTSGYGNPNGNQGAGGVVIIGGEIKQPELRPWVSLTLRYTQSSCSTQVNVPRSLYLTMNTYLYRLLDENGVPQKVLSPAQQAMILFYTTILGQAKGCDAGKG